MQGEHWSQKKEKASSVKPVKFMIFLVKIFPHWLLTCFAFFVGFFYFLFSKSARRDAVNFQKTVIDFCKKNNIKCAIKKPGSYRQIISFAICLIEKIEGWCGKSDLSHVVFHDDDVVELKASLAAGKGAMLIGSHLGNMELFRSLATEGQTGVGKMVSVTAIMDTKVTSSFNQAMEDMNSKTYLDVINSDSIGVDTVEILQDRLASGGLVVIAGDRTSANSPDRNIEEEFLGKTAEFPFGSFFMASLLDVPVYFVFALRVKDLTLKSKYDMHVKKAGVDFNCNRKEKKVRIEELCREFKCELEKHCCNHPYQWYNFFDFWRKSNDR
ncbi:hypothetical protein [Treponema sp.]|uniref:LpxL/LpxP family acyltransferase n=1 Tax=Treponema sp. TaxID=166 RepID=UPI0025E51E70|nr:hypothetical protein [Treponema sp.]MCR5218043.1 hypothetical protein [Treponema sp.]